MYRSAVQRKKSYSVAAIIMGKEGDFDLKQGYIYDICTLDL
jgi:hypothetical protein